MLASISDVLRAKFENQESAMEILDFSTRNVRAEERASWYIDYGQIYHYEDEDPYASEGPCHDDDELFYGGRTSSGRD